MNRDIINAPALHEAIEDALESAPPALQDYRFGLRAYLRHGAEKHDSIRKARRRKSDPSWAHIKFDEDRALFHYFGVPDDVDYAQIPWRSGQFDPTALDAALASAGQWPMKRASIFLGQEAFRLLIWPICAQFLQWTQSSAELSDSAFSIPIWQKKN